VLYQILELIYFKIFCGVHSKEIENVFLLLHK